jgi:uncharacterized membrane protein
MSDLIVIAYDSPDGGAKALQMIDTLQKQQLITVVDAAVAVKDDKGKVKVKQTLEKQQTGSAAVWGGFWGLVGALLGGLMGRATDIGIDNKFIKEVGDSLEPGNSAIFMLVAEATGDRAAAEFAKLGGTVYQTSLSVEDEEKLKKALEHDNVSAAAEDSLELE